MRVTKIHKFLILENLKAKPNRDSNINCNWLKLVLRKRIKKIFQNISHLFLQSKTVK